MISYQTTTPGGPLARVESETPQPQGSEVLVKMLACGVCHSDIHMHDGVFELGGGKQLDVGQEGLVLGHEIFGEVVAVGSEAENVNVGDRRVVFPWIGCGECASCKRGEEQLCTPGRALGIVKAGGYADHVLVPHSRYLFDKGDTNDSLAATYACSGLTAFGALKKAGELGEGDEIVIIGAGGVGMMAIQIARAQGIDPIVVDIDEAKLQSARDIGVSRTFDSSDPQTSREIRKATGGAYAVLDFVGAEATVNYGLGCLRKGGMLIIVGLYGGALTIPIPFLPMNARIIQGSYVGTLQDMSDLMELVRAGKISPIEIHERPLSEASDALADLKGGKIRGRQVLVNA
ncbi:MAG: alcohol dehydrogenase catalytic domain-containing protein [Gammaproteobacteria bacterium]|jgi:D-arabinose 1-dehydrogenase-like Zn-dependent alcohol dehydrogenase|nr:alcohol dehydrogenase catalytic domain-containing protein [Gammaproteobacteria bacterium]MBT3859689.1 alcohol dehydrogenase catalytic domain-containing protein [Gammaproteobacteria bacterium]MBT3987210.1 alcohol dehydrogenase catalytic domain-containing protein [Gammaproteobacteria bacterium]MBT4256749.1 alcohol dehydrogenase catalytic domain-containing protein [Gammaproteobacteria bacterium]MBT4581598.1 alcohol dehydrogenase catalytic domain-containing protein [Gammaproteobacteria bacterium